MNVLPELLIGSPTFRPLGIDPRFVRERLRPFLGSRPEAFAGAWGVPIVGEAEWRELNFDTPELESAVFERLLRQHTEVEPVEFLDLVPVGEDWWIFPSDSGPDPQIMFVELGEFNGELVLDVVGTEFDADASSKQLVQWVGETLRSPLDWLSRRRRHRCPIRFGDMTCAAWDCSGTCEKYRKSDPDRVRWVCACIS